MLTATFKTVNTAAISAVLSTENFATIKCNYTHKKSSKKQLESYGSLGTAQPRAAPDVCDSHRLSKILILIDLNATSAVISENSVHEKIEMSLK